MSWRPSLIRYGLIISGSTLNLIILLSNKSNNIGVSFPKIIHADCGALYPEDRKKKVPEGFISFFKRENVENIIMH